LGIAAIIFRFWPFGQSSTLKKNRLRDHSALPFFPGGRFIVRRRPDRGEHRFAQGRCGNGAFAPASRDVIHPPIVFLGYALWDDPLRSRLGGMIRRKSGFGLDSRRSTLGNLCLELARRGNCLGGLLAYEETRLGWLLGLGSRGKRLLDPWLMGTAFLHAALAWRSRGILKKTTISLAIATFALCNFAAFITRSGFFSSLHAFNQSPLGLDVLDSNGGASPLAAASSYYFGELF